MPVYNGQQHLRQAIQSIQAQTLGDFEFLIIDDGSTDGSAGIAGEQAARDPRIRLLRRAHGGVTAALNEGARQARGEYLARMDADDIAHPQRFARQVAFLKAHPEVVAVGSAVLLIDAAGAAVTEQRWPLTHEEIDARLLQGQSGLAHPTALIRAAAFRAVGGYREQFRVAQDFDLWARLAEVGRLANLPEVLLSYRISPRSVSWTRCAEQQASVHRALEETCRRRGIPVRPPLVPLAVPSRGESEACRHLAQQALLAGHAATARKYASSAIGLKPWCWRSWVLWVLGSFLGTPLRGFMRRYLEKRQGSLSR